MNGGNLIKLVTANLGCTQKALATQLDVSGAQISKWKNGEYLSEEMERLLVSLAGIGNRDPDIVIWTGGNEQADQWDALVRFLASLSLEFNDTGYYIEPLTLVEDDFLCWKVLHTLLEAGIALPHDFPEQLAIDYAKYAEKGAQLPIEFSSHPIVQLIFESFKALIHLYGFYSAYISEIMENWDLNLMDTEACNIEPCLLDLAFSKSARQSHLLPEFNDFKHKTINEYRQWLELVKKNAYERNVPLRAELLNLIYDNHENVGYAAKEENTGANRYRLHPDVYMNEMLHNQRTILKLMPAICEKLGIDIEDSECLDSSIATAITQVST
ncbi:XRE family transcriptional regulator [Thalassotalea litorea]|uniref:XRE family transcriptional regulator n=1 Tax=Thalassotalea litorea TaxID=2020715 RepID=A0A5R9INP0_9GAMM|nr:XRE family transcriptional regulator [Thalassotalea litorea]TLU65697.1 XRE family transcriptional regulator [Thalassotalea litorea]